MTYNLPHTVEETKQGVEKLIEGDTIRKEQICDLSEEFSKPSAAKDDLIKQYEKCWDIPPEKLVVVKKF